MKINEVNAKENGFGVTVIAYADSEKYGEATLAVFVGEDERLCVYGERINPVDPGEGPLDEYEDRDEALASEYGEAFKPLVALADAMIG